jgi:phosphopantothenoylcysteine decarboxylase / phosphopantothenate---cysteine ligase
MNVVLGITGGISVYKVCELVRLLKRHNHEVDVMMTKSALGFVTPLTFQTLSQNVVVTELFEQSENWDIEHITLAKKADVIAIVPATANIIGKIANGIGDDFLTTTVMATLAPILICPAMNTIMFENPIVQKNISTLKKNGYFILEPASGNLACGDVGKGKLPEVSIIYDKIMELGHVQNDFEGKKILITAGPTREPIDPVRFLSNRSSGKMGYEIAEEATRRGAEVLVVSGPVDLSQSQSFKVEKVVRGEEMYQKVVENIEDFDIVIFVAAVSDYVSKNQNLHKMNKESDEFSLELIKNVDIAKEIGAKYKDKFLVGFCAETQNLIERAKEKRKAKNFDMIIANDVSSKDSGFEVDTNRVIILDRFEQEIICPMMSKKDTANKILDEILKNFPKK